ncbi:MAG: septation protein A [Methylococcales symbiont of Iophon sp. n. MRB-2018]|nr:MAG: septation protein A [Methylococcales symbiont of Iophon sp. n. MRB-2018]KAF3980507.1 MAG: septation protein A [Methylococcales symbiont of Iophon sp. n. MRB-2018]
MKKLIEFIPVILFFITYKLYDIYTATAVVIVVTTIQVIFTWFKYKKVETMQLITLGLILVMGGLTLYLQDEQFIKWKLTILEWLFGIAFLGSQFLGKKTFVERMMGSSLELPSLVWKRLNLIWATFFISVGFINIYVIENYNTSDWVTFKTFGVPGLMLVFVFVQMIFIYKYIPTTEE